jgi:hypothetical protein
MNGLDVWRWGYPVYDSITPKKGGRNMPGIWNLLKGYDRFLAMARWDYTEDQRAAEKFNLLMDALPGEIDRNTFQSYYLPGERMTVVIGQVKTGVPGGAAAALLKLSTMVTFGANAEVNFYHAVEAHEMEEVMKGLKGKTQTAKKKG